MINLIKKYKSWLREIFLYGIFGMTSAGIDTLSFYLLSKTVLPVLAANFFSVNIGIALSFFLNTFFNFKKSSNLGKRAFTFFGIGYIGLALSTLIMHIGVNIMGQNEMIVKIVSVFLIAAVQYVLNKFITYKN